MSNYYKNRTFASEEIIYEELKKSKYKEKVSRNNIEKITETDLLVENLEIDVQFSDNFDRYGEARIDMLSAFNFKNNYSKTLSMKEIDLDNPSKLSLDLKIYKFGKWFDKNLHGVIFLFYNGKSPRLDSINEYKEYLSKNLVKIVYLKRSSLNKLFNQNKNIIKEIKVNNKKGNNIYESHQSAFLPINVEYLVKNNFCNEFLSFDDFIKNIEI